jgi:hypothetical protein
MISAIESQFESFKNDLIEKHKEETILLKKNFDDQIKALKDANNSENRMIELIDQILRSNAANINEHTGE